MLVISSKEFRDNQTQYLNRIDEGEQVIVKRGKNKAYAIRSATEDDLYFTPEMIAKIERAMTQAEQGEGTVCNTYEESAKFLDSL